MKALMGVRVLWAADAAVDQEQHALWLRSEGAELHLCPWSELASAAQRITPSVVVVDLRDTQQREAELLHVQALPALRGLPVIAIVPSSTSSAARLPSSVQISKLLVAPFHPADLVTAIAGLATSAAQPTASVPSTFESVMNARMERRDLRGLLELLNASGPFRYTAILRFDDQRLTSLWTFDRDNPAVDSFPIDKAVQESYCALVLETKAPFSMPDAGAEPTVQEHPARHVVLSYCGVPLQRKDGSVFGTLCQFDVVPRFFRESTMQRLQGTAQLLESHLHWLSKPREP